MTKTYKQRTTSLGLGALLGALTGLSILILALATQFFVLPHGPNSAPEMGPLGTFFVFSLLFSVSYVCIFLVAAIPSFLVLYARIEHIRLWQWLLYGGTLFGFGIPILNRFFSGPTNFGSTMYEAALGSAAGIASFWVVHISCQQNAT
jgi:hypothetical protein